MARQKNVSTADPSEVRALAEKLFVQHWLGPKTQYESGHTIEKCFEAAEAFVKFAGSNRPVRTTEAELEPTDTGS